MPVVRGYGLYAGCKRGELNQARQQSGQTAVAPEQVRPLRWQDYCEQRGQGAAAKCSVCGKPLLHVLLPPSNRGPPVARREAVA